ncbi:EAL domain-containing protein [Sulfurovum sp. XGS-02]|uniref:putative bifunctional diguanylate cyclase/phosphodiesterase n=1 Tax=Sulfurovum sp. XGS-02 TaxID=2925411 RepID=UPI00206478FE|nr:EAL domain-containing protein [Sulfurovum sp. XGS-02]UPT77002.1 EAL domain-containing protein [Sulfurovum sp. XGS-02]
MEYLKELFQLRKHRVVDQNTLDNVYNFARKSLISLVLLETIFLYLLTPYVGNHAFVWYGITVVFTLWRLHDAYDYKNHVERYSLERWHKRFVIRSWMTALMYAILILFITPQLNDYYQMLVFVIILGMSSAEANTLSYDYRTAIGFLLILYIPLFMTMLLITKVETIILAFLLLIYFFAQANIILHSYNQKKTLESKEEIISEMEVMLQEKQELLHSLFEEAPIGIFSCDTDCSIINCNEKLSTLFQRPQEEIIGQTAYKVFQNSTSGDLHRVLRGNSLVSKDSHLLPNNEELLVEIKYFPFTDSDNKSIGLIGLVDDKTQEHKVQEQLSILAAQDALTSLLNRRGFEEYMQSLTNDLRYGTYYSLLYYLDLNDFKNINDTLGHSTGDIVLIDISRRLSKALTVSCEICRLGGDEFIIMIPFISTNMEVMQERMHYFSEKIIDTFKEPLVIHNSSHLLSASMGMLIVEPGFNDIGELIRQADIAMYQAKGSGEATSFYNAVLDQKQQEEFALQSDLHHALRNREFILLLQPIVSMTDDTVIAAETLLRWQHPTKGLLNPDKFIPLLMKSGLLWDTTWWILEQTCIQISTWKRQNRWNLEYISINIDVLQLLEDNFAPRYLSMIERHGLKCSDITFEITEQTLIENFKNTKEVISTLQQNGVRFAIDDFGVGYSSLSYIQNLSLDTIKIDKSFVLNIENNVSDIALIKTILHIAEQFDYTLVIEGIENEKQKKLLYDLDNKLVYQGFHFSKPITKEEFGIRYLYSINMIAS